MDAPYSIWPIDELKRVFATLISPFPWRRARSIVFGGKLEEALTSPTVQTVSQWLLWVLKNEAAKVPLLIWEESAFWSMVWKTFSIAFFCMGNYLIMLVFPCCNSMLAFAPVFSEKELFPLQKSPKTSFLGFFNTFLGTSASALGITHNSCKNELNVVQDLKRFDTKCKGNQKSSWSTFSDAFSIKKTSFVILAKNH